MIKNRFIYLAYDLSFDYCINEIYTKLKEIYSNILLGEVKHSQNLSTSQQFSEGYCKLGYHYYKTDCIHADGILLFIGKDGMNVSDYSENGNVYSILANSGYSQAFVYSDYQIQTIVFIVIHIKDRI